MNFTSVAIQVATQASNQALPFSGPLVEALLKDLLNVQDEQMTVLRSVDEGLDRLINGPWRAGSLRLEEAALPDLPRSSVESLLRSAAEKFRDAAGLQPNDSFLQASVFVDLAMTLALLRETTASRHYAEQAYLTARRAMWKMTLSAPQPTLTRDHQLQRDSDYLQECAYFRAVELASAALGDPVGLSQSAPLASEQVAWREGALLDYRYLAQREKLGEVHPHLGYHGDPWFEFATNDASIVNHPKKPVLPSFGDNHKLQLAAVGWYENFGGD